MTEFFSSLLNIATLVFAVSSMLSVGATYNVRELIRPLRNARLVISTLVANFVLVPLLAFAIIGFLSIGEGREIGLILVASAAGWGGIANEGCCVRHNTLQGTTPRAPASSLQERGLEPVLLAGQPDARRLKGR